MFRLLLLAAVALLGMAMPAWSAPKNIVLFVADDLGRDLGCYGNTVIQTPNIDRFAKEGTVFTHAFATTASCSASRSVILTGLHNHANAHYGHQHAYHHFSAYDWVKSLPVLLGKGGYRTARVGKYHVAPEEVFQFDHAFPGNSRDVVTMTDNSREFIAAKSDQPFFLYICTSDPHRGGGKATELPHQPDRFGNLETGTYKGITPIKYSPNDVLVPPFLPDTPACRAELAQYYEAVSRIDQGFGYLLETLKKAGVYEDTLILLISDHGIAMPGGKTTVYEPGLNSPCIVRGPTASQRGIESNAMVSWVDLTPTLLDFAGVLDPATGTVPVDMASLPGKGKGKEKKAEPYRFHGRSFLSVVDQTKPEGWDRINASHTFHEIQMYYPMRVVRERQYKLIWNIAYPLPYPFASDLWAAATWQAQWKLGKDAPYGKRTVGQYIQRPKFELYDLRKDPHESQNLAEDPQFQSVLLEMQQKLKRFQQDASDPWILKWEYE